jgi:hypothetical protein
MTAGSGSSGSARPLVSTSAYTYAVSLRVRHPSMDPERVTQAMHLSPEFCWKAGEVRKSQSGAALGGQYRESYWSARLPSQMVEDRNVPLEPMILQQLLQLNRHRDFLAQLQRDGGSVSIVVEISPVPSGVLTLSSMVCRRLADLDVELEFQFVEE